MKRRSAVHIGTSGWHYPHWQGPFYPKTLNKKDFFAYYAERFDTVEINNSFYRLPEPQTLETWRDQAPDGFRFSVKASRYITHMKKLKDPEDAAALFFDRIVMLEDKGGPVLFQLPPNWRVNAARLEDFLAALPPEFRCAFEFRDKSWFTDAVFGALEKYNAALCLYAMGDYASPRETTADFVYVRLHGPGEKYEGKYEVNALSGWAGAFSSWAASGKDVYCYFDNDENGYAALNALELKEMM